VLHLPEVRKLLSSEHFSIDGTLIEAWAYEKLCAEGEKQGAAEWRAQRRVGFSRREESQ
jgi:hypothetical protein